MVAEALNREDLAAAGRGCRIEAMGLTRAYDSGSGETRVLDGLDLVVAPGETVVILGVSGTGKSTLLNVLGGIDRPTAGRLMVAGRDLLSLSGRELTGFRREVVGFVFQFFNLIPSFTALENVLSALEAAGRKGREGEERARELLERVGLSARMDAFPEQLSGGEQQRVAIARALVKSPPLLLADEPTGNLDPDTGDRIADLLIEQARTSGATLVIVTHNRQIGRRADRILSLVRGRLVAVEDGK
jgi:putative ABC transport system ATP-binding protein